jgi:hypothetical protein
MLATGAPMRFDTRAAYHYIVLDPLLSGETYQLLRGQSRCSLPVNHNRANIIHLPADCFPSGRLHFGGHSLSFTPLCAPPLPNP